MNARAHTCATRAHHMHTVCLSLKHTRACPWRARAVLQRRARAREARGVQGRGGAGGGGRCCACTSAQLHSCLAVLSVHDMRMGVLSPPHALEDDVWSSPRQNDDALGNSHPLTPPLPRVPPQGAHRSGSEAAALAVIGYAVASYALYAAATNPLTGALLGLAGAWIGACGGVGGLGGRVDRCVGGVGRAWGEWGAWGW